MEQKNEFELAMVNEPSVFELLRFDCITPGNHPRTENGMIYLVKYGINMVPYIKSINKM